MGDKDDSSGAGGKASKSSTGTSTNPKEAAKPPGHPLRLNAPNANKSNFVGDGKTRYTITNDKGTERK